MDNGKRICRTLKELRKRITEANGLRFEIEECTHKGRCPGTCPKCETELEKLLDELHWLEQDGATLNLRNVMTEEELRMFYTGSPEKVEIQEPFETAGIPVRPEDEIEVLQGDICDPEITEGMPEPPSEEQFLMGEVAPNFGNTPFTMKVAEQLMSLNPDKNIVFSPVGLFYILKMLQDGMAEDSSVYRTFDYLLGWNDSTIEQSHNDGFVLEHSTSLWFDKKTGLLNADYIEKLRNFYQTIAFNADFSNGGEVSQAIDRWVSDNTHKMIERLGMNISPDALMVLIDALYLKAKWASPFDAESTSQRVFHNADGTTTQVNMMHKWFDDVEYEETEEYQTIRLPYRGNEFDMTIVLPKKGYDLDEVVNGENWMFLTPMEGEVDFSMPRFKMDMRLDCKDLLMSMGMGAIFEREDSFPLMTDVPAHVSQIFQQCAIAVDEEETEAAAVTVAEFEVGCCPPVEEPKVYHMNVNRPFGFVIKDKNDQVIFLGVINNLGDAMIKPEPQPNEICLESITVAGTTHIPDIEEFAWQIDEGTELTLRRDKDNKYDRYAIAVYLDEQRVGYVPREKCRILAKLMDAGKHFVCRVTSADWQRDWLRIDADISMVD